MNQSFSTPLKIAMLVVDANEVSGLTHRDESLLSPVVHSAIQNLLNGLRCRDDIQVFVVYGRRAAQESEIRQEGCLHYLPVSCGPVAFVPGMGSAFLGRTLALVRAVRKLKPDLVHGQGTERESGMVAALTGFPSVLTLHGNMRELARSLPAPRLSYFGLAAMLERWVLPRVSMVHCISIHTQKSVKSLARATKIIPNAVAPIFFDVVNHPAEHPVVVCMAGIAEWKNPRMLVWASDRLHDAFHDTEVHFFGSADPNHPYAASFLREIADRPWCSFHGQQAAAKLTVLLQRATCSVLPSKQENFGLALAEAMAAGVPVLGANTGGIPDVIKDQTTGLLFDPDDPEALGRLLVSLHSDPALMNRLAAAGRAEAAARFTIESVAESHLTMYRQVAALKP